MVASLRLAANMLFCCFRMGTDISSEPQIQSKPRLTLKMKVAMVARIF